MSERERYIDPEGDHTLSERLLAERPELRPRFEAIWERKRDIRSAAELTVHDLIGHFSRGAPSRRGLLISLSALYQLLDELDQELIEETRRERRRERKGRAS